MTPSTDTQAVDWFLSHAVENVLPSKEALREKLLSGARLRVYLGLDPTGPTIHIGHVIQLQKMAELQALGHEIILLLGDFTAMIGDPTDKTATRKRLSREEVLENLKQYTAQASRFLRFDGPNPAQVKLNSEWLGAMSFSDVVELAAHFTVQQMMERDMFEKRLAEQKPIYLHEFMYPLMQGYDSVALNVDMEIGGNDQTFNMLAGRTLLREMKGKEKFVMSCKLLADPTGKKMGKSEGNMIALTDHPNDAYGKIMSWTDAMILPGFSVLTNLTYAELDECKARLDAGENPMTLKRELAERVVSTCFGADEAKEAREHFARVHQEHERPTDIPVVTVSWKEAALVDALVEGGLVPSKSEARRQIEQGGVRVNDETITDVNARISLEGGEVVLQKGKRHFVKLSAV